jgi:hypothetical protein
MLPTITPRLNDVGIQLRPIRSFAALGGNSTLAGEIHHGKENHYPEYREDRIF